MYTSSPFASSSCTITKISIPDGMAEKIKSITKSFEEISNARRDFHLREDDGARLVTGPQIRQPTSSYVDTKAIFGRNEEKEKIISRLNPSSGPDFMVLPIVGAGGFGKTTLAQLVYNDSRVDQLFDKRGWISVSENFDLVRLTKATIESLSEIPCGFSELSKLQDVLKKKIRGISLFLVLDDVWNEKENLWECFRVGLIGAKIVRILTTTRNTSVAEVMQTTSPFHLGCLPRENCWSLFNHFAFGNKEARQDANLLKIGRGIVEKCKGSPLAIKALGGSLRYEMDIDKWREVLESNISEIDETEEIMPALLLSYWKLRLQLRPCFLYLSMFPKGKGFEKDMVVRLWMAQGYISGNTRNLKMLEEIGSEYFDELHGRSLIDSGRDKEYFLHDLIYDLARSISQGSCQPVLGNDQIWNSSCKIHHLYLTKRHELSNLLVPCKYSFIRTFVKECTTSQLSDCAIFSEIACVRALHSRYSVSLEVLGTLKHLRYMYVTNHEILRLPESLCLLYNLQTMHLSCYKLQELPENMKNLINLRYLHLNSLEIKQLPESIFQLRKLHTLSFRYCGKIKELPRGMEQLTRLRILELPESLINMPYGIGKLTTLKPLSGHFNIMDHGMMGGLGELKDMNKLSGLLCISGLKKIGDVDCSRKFDLASKPNLNTLILNFEEAIHVFQEALKRDGHVCSTFIRGHWDAQQLHLSVSSSNAAKNENVEKKQESVLESLRPCGTITELKILHYRGKTFPSWLIYSLLPKLIAVTIDCCSEPPFLPPFGQFAYLKFLKISGNTCVKDVGDEPSPHLLLGTAGSSKQHTEVSFPSLKVLSLTNMPYLKWQTHDSDFPCLKELRIENCPKLGEIATIPREVSKLVVKDCGCHKIQLSSRCKIQDILISNCRELISVHSMGGYLPIAEKILVIDCPKLYKFSGIHELSVRESISIISCPRLGIFPTILEKVKMLTIRNCGISELMLPSISETLTISNCRELISINWSDGGLNSTAVVTFECCPELKFLTIPSGIKKLRIDNSGFREIMFPSISDKLTISNCLELISLNCRDKHFNSINEVIFECCPKLILSAIPTRIKKLKIHDCGFRELMLPTRSDLTISNCPELISINWGDEGFNSTAHITLECCPKLKLLTIPSKIKQLKIHECGFREITFPSISEKVCISNCSELISVNWRDDQVSSINEVTFECCPMLILSGIPTQIKKLQIHECGILDIKFPPISEKLTISNCLELTSIAWRYEHLNSIEEVTFKCCPKLILPIIPMGIKKLNISYCGIQEIVFPFQSRIQMVDISNCPVLTSIRWAKRDMPFQTKLPFKDCPEMKQGLESLQISYCSILQFPITSVLHLITKRAEIYDCPRMNLGERYVYQRDTRVKELNVIGNKEIYLPHASVNFMIPLLENSFTLFLTKGKSPEVESLTCPHNVGLSCQYIMLNLSSLVTLEISRCRKVISLTGLDNLSKLMRLSISGCSELCDWKDRRLPVALKFLELQCCENLRSVPLLSVENQSSSLKTLVVINCPVLSVLEGFNGLKNLRTVELLYCKNINIRPATENLKFRPHITITGCPLLRDWCQRNNITDYELEECSTGMGFYMGNDIEECSERSNTDDLRQKTNLTLLNA